MFKLLYNFWLFCFKISNSNVFFKKNIAFLSKHFGDLSFFKKLLVILLSDTTVEKNANVINFRRKNYPMIHTFHISLHNDRITQPFSLKQFYREVNFINSNLEEHTFVKKMFNGSTIFNFFFLKKLFSKHFYTFFEDNSSVKINFIMNQVLDVNINHFNSYKIYNLNFYSHWYKYNFDNNQFVFPQLMLSSLHNFFDLAKFKKTDLFYFNSDLRNTSLINIRINFFNKLQALYPVHFSESSTNKFINLNNLKNYCFFFLRKNKIFNKGRYSRNRQLYRTGFYWCLYFNIISVYGLYFLFYRVVFNFGYIWLFVIVFFGSFIFSRMLKYNYFNVQFIVTEVRKSFIWFSFLVDNLFTNYRNTIIQTTKWLALSGKSNSTYFLGFLTKFNLNHDLFRFTFFWKSLSNFDNSPLKFNSMLNYITQLPLFFKNR